MFSDKIIEKNAKKKKLDGYLTIAIVALVIWVAIP